MKKLIKEEVVSDVRFIHPHFVSGQGRATVAWKPHPAHEGLVVAGVAWCSPRDHFRRDKGRRIAEGRLNKKPLEVVVTLVERGDRKVVDERSILAAIYWPDTKADIPRWAKDDALLIPKREKKEKIA
jgi:hypothetical protein